MKLFKNNKSGRSLIPNISFLSRIFQMRRYFLTTCTKDVHEEKNIKQMEDYPQEKGRSMIEMLGVLAIIGVLSIGGIAGYSKAMFKYKMNKTMETVSNAIARMVELENSNMGNIVIMKAQELRDYGIIPDCKPSGNYMCQQPFGSINTTFSHDSVSFGITFTEHRYESCIAFYNSKIYETVPDHWWYSDLGFSYIATISTRDYYEDGDLMGEEPYEEYTYTGPGDKLTQDDIIKGCEPCKYGKSSCTISWVMDHY